MGYEMKQLGETELVQINGGAATIGAMFCCALISGAVLFVIECYNKGKEDGYNDMDRDILYEELMA